MYCITVQCNVVVCASEQRTESAISHNLSARWETFVFLIDTFQNRSNGKFQSAAETPAICSKPCLTFYSSFFVGNPSDLHIWLDNTHWMASYLYKEKYLNSEGEFLFVFQFYFNFYLFKDKYSHSGGEFLLTCTQSIPYRPNMSEKIKTEPYNAMQ